MLVGIIRDVTTGLGDGLLGDGLLGQVDPVDTYAGGFYGSGTYGDYGVTSLFKGITTRGPGKDDLVLEGTGPFEVLGTDAEIVTEVWVRGGVLEVLD